MIRLIILILAFTVFSYGQSPTPAPILNDEQKTREVEFEKKRLAEEKLLPAKPSASLYAKYEMDKHINLFLNSYRAKIDEPESAKMKVCFDIAQHFQQEISKEDFLIENAVLLVDGREIPFKLPKEGIPDLEQGFPENNLSRRWQFQIMLSSEEILFLKRAVSISVRWSEGNFELDESGLETVKRFFAEEMPNDTTEQTGVSFSQEYRGKSIIYSYLSWLMQV